MDCSLPGSSVHGISQARILEWVAISFSRGSSKPRDQTHISFIGRQILYHTEQPGFPDLYMHIYCAVPCCAHLYLTLATPWTVAHHTPLSMEFPRQEYWSGLPFPSSGDLPDPGTKLASSALVGSFFTTEPPGQITLGCFKLLCLWNSLPSIRELICLVILHD